MNAALSIITQQVECWEKLHHPALLERFVVRNGKPFAPVKRIGRKGKANECYSNAAQFVFRNGGTYVEGFATSKALPFAFHHAWVSIGGLAMDPTLDAESYVYFGVEFGAETLRAEMLRNGVYGILDPGFGLNVDLMFRLDPELEAICDAMMADKRRSA